MPKTTSMQVQDEYLFIHDGSKDLVSIYTDEGRVKVRDFESSKIVNLIKYNCDGVVDNSNNSTNSRFILSCKYKTTLLNSRMDKIKDTNSVYTSNMKVVNGFP